MPDRNQRLRLGIFTLVAMTALGGLILFFGGSPDWFQPRNNFVVLFPDAPGVTVGTPVRRSGVRVGEVGEMELDDRTGLVRLVLRIDPKYNPRTKEQITISRNLLGADSSIDFVPSEPDEQPPDLGEPIPIGTELIGISPPTPRSLLTQASDVLPSAQSSLETIRKSVQRFEKIAPRVEETLESFRNLAESVNEVVPEIRRTNDEVRIFIAATRNLGPEILKTNDQLRVLLLNGSNLAEEIRNTVKINEPEVMRTVKNIGDTAGRLSQVLNEQNQQQFADVLKNVNASTKRIESLTTTADETLREFQKTVPQIQQLITQTEMTIRDFRSVVQPIAQRAEKVASNIEATTEQVRGITTDVREVIRMLARADGTVQRLLGDPALYDNINGVAAGINRMLPKVDRILLDIEVFADKIARHPESIGVGGAVRPSTGLKDSPTAPLFRPK